MAAPEYVITSDLAEARSCRESATRCLLYHGDCRELLPQLPSESVQLIVTSPPYNIGKRYEQKKTLEEYCDLQAEVIEECSPPCSLKGAVLGCKASGHALSTRRSMLRTPKVTSR